MPAEPLYDYCERHGWGMEPMRLEEDGYVVVRYDWGDNFHELSSWLKENVGRDYVFNRHGVWLNDDVAAFKFKMYWC